MQSTAQAYYSIMPTFSILRLNSSGIGGEVSKVISSCFCSTIIWARPLLGSYWDRQGVGYWDF